MTNELATGTEILFTIHGDGIKAIIARITDGRFSVIFKDTDTDFLVSTGARLFATRDAAVAYAVDQLGLVLADFVERRDVTCSSGETDLFSCNNCDGDSDPEPSIDDAGRRTVKHVGDCFVASL